jgi:hypothetical protein
MPRHLALSQQKQAIHSPEPSSVAACFLAAFNGRAPAGLTGRSAVSRMMHRNHPIAKHFRASRALAQS